MKILIKTLLAILFAVALIQVLLLVNSNTNLSLSNFRALALTGGAASIYYFFFERKPKK